MRNLAQKYRTWLEKVKNEITPVTIKLLLSPHRRDKLWQDISQNK